ncbi:PP2C family protein-serine/threonine phosphatase [Cellulomonas composti]|uniref:PPM-type phosphatase domain-containing protein n=1 Tax=Cellulomonas composti TaxID=266130 RepID=A0A511J6R9_9CELL|nr:protein phosphatase 2C domain-containing protein [Cellulomonas composti]GEL93706.1 hypothetical protein CCO02nite_03640 [Cellulomonas composti]
MDHVVSAVEALCAACGSTLAPDARFCETCGARIEPVEPEAPPEPDDVASAGAGGVGTAAAACVACGGQIAPDGYCVQCGRPATSPRDHWVEQPSPLVGGVCDRGVRHSRNEDAMALAGGDGYALLVVCDGVSSAPDSDVASMAAAKAALAVLEQGVAGGARAVTGSGTGRTAAWSGLLAEAAAAGDAAITAAFTELAHDVEPPSCTFVAGVVDGAHIVVGWLGDSRAYWMPDDAVPQQLSADDSGAAELMAQGVARAQAETSPVAHAITRWLGPDAPDTTARTTTTTVHGPGWLLVCSDGLWNYCSPADELADLLRATAADQGGDPALTAGALVTWANAQGGRDNVTVALARVEPPVSVRSDSLTAPTDLN